MNLDLSDDEELAQAFDVHSMIISSLQNEPILTAEEVINEIDTTAQSEYLIVHQLKSSFEGIGIHWSPSPQSLLYVLVCLLQEYELGTREWL